MLVRHRAVTYVIRTAADLKTPEQVCLLNDQVWSLDEHKIQDMCDCMLPKRDQLELLLGWDTHLVGVQLPWDWIMDKAYKKVARIK